MIYIKMYAVPNFANLAFCCAHYSCILIIYIYPPLRAHTGSSHDIKQSNNIHSSLVLSIIICGSSQGRGVHGGWKQTSVYFLRAINVCMIITELKGTTWVQCCAIDFFAYCYPSADHQTVYTIQADLIAIGQTCSTYVGIPNAFLQA